MASTITPVFVGNNFIRYLFAFTDTDGAETATLFVTGGAPGADIETDLGESSGVMRALVKARAQGYGQIPAGGATDDRARALWLSDWSGEQPAIAGNKLLPTAQCKLTPRTGAGETWFVDAVADQVAQIPHYTIEVTASGDGTAYLDIEIPGSIGI